MSMDRRAEIWTPGSFTKNFSWGPKENGLRQLHEAINIGFAGSTEDVRRDTFRERVRVKNLIDYVPMNFFLFNRTVGGVDYILADELVLQAVSQPHSSRFDKLALFAFVFSFVGSWRGARRGQRWPALWAFHYVRERVGPSFDWQSNRITADDIEHYVIKDPRYKAETARKLATNAKYMFDMGKLNEFQDRRVERWWVDALFLALDRIIEDRAIDGVTIQENQYQKSLYESGFHEVSGKRSYEKDLAIPHLIGLYNRCGGRQRFDMDFVKEQSLFLEPSSLPLGLNDQRLRGALHPTNARILKSIPWYCTILARYAGFEVINSDELENFDLEYFVRAQAERALEALQSSNIQPSMSVEELLRMTRGR